ncbi:MAG: hypothetical protein ACOWWR_06180 [Eubacteriales bacterium]
MRNSTDLIVDTNTFKSILSDYGLPSDNIVASNEQIRIVGTNLPHFLEALSTEEKRDARYLSKFIGASSIGLFDAALNYIWNEVILILRKKAILYGLDMFYDSAIGGNNRSLYKDEGDLQGIKDIVLLDTCKKLELISEVVYKKLNFILTMRNDVAASHPNVESIGGYELLGWLETCVRDVIQDKPSESAIKIKSFIDNIRTSRIPFDTSTTTRLIHGINELSTPHANNLLLTLFGIYTDSQDQIFKKNIAHIAPTLWGASTDKVKFTIGSRIDGYRTNLNYDKLANGSEFLRIVDGRNYETLTAKIIAIGALCERLEAARVGHDNYYTEPPVMQEILSYCKVAGDIPSEISTDLITTVFLCRLGRGLAYYRGVSPTGCSKYESFISILNDTQKIVIIKLFFDPVVRCKFENKIRQQQLAKILEILLSTAINDRILQIVNFLIENVSQADELYRNKIFIDLCKPII